MSEKMYVVQFEAYFIIGTTVEQAEKIIKGVAEVCPFPLNVRDDYDGVHVREVAFVDNLNELDSAEFRNAVNKMLADEKTKASPPRIGIFGAYYWEMDVDDPTWTKSYNVRSG